ncbi:EAL domain-containing response regulator [Pseudomonas sp. NW5]|uniref:EAL domain-containing response regulator n=1 Tax=Pseudomonas sp. NW5 TaxID=2934934 RepID=UPI00202140A4|nr:EAL domain-containing response regulator [Pseudomonas sp. NW5]MCL7463371.1 EAL domain-containing response regulator [Pseudomonas sp. NW5]
MNILIVDDDPLICRLLTRQLRDLSLEQVHVCHQASDALAWLAEHPETGLVFCDLQMPELDGIEFIRHLSGMTYGGALVLISGEEDPRLLHSARRLARAHGLNVPGALQKPIDRTQLAQLIPLCSAASAQTGTRGARIPHTRDDLLHALEQRQIVNHYQPKVTFQKGAVVGVEALARWQHPQLGLVGADHFIPLAEACGLIDPLFRQILQQALQDARRWHANGHPLHVAVNVSAKNLHTLDLPDLIASETAAAGLPLSCLTLEITESHLIEDLQTTLDILTRLHLKRIKLSIDDFGTGHSSLAQLRDIPFSELKLDRSFVHGAAHDPARRSILNASLKMAAQLGMRTVAEGVEDQSDWDYLYQAGCDLAQGWLIARAMPEDALSAWLEQWPQQRQALLGL